MIRTFQNDDDGYLQWLDDNPNGFVVNSFRNPSPDYMVLHRSSCRRIRELARNAGPGGFTSRNYIKICADNLSELGRWAKRNGSPDGDFSHYCSFCDA